MKQILVVFSLVLLSLGLTACSNGEPSAVEGKAYQVEASFDVDSTVVLDHLWLYTDNHVTLRSDSLFLSPEHTFAHQGATIGLDELYLCADGGELCRIYAAGGMEVSVSLRSDSVGLQVTFAPTETDSINPWLQQQTSLCDSLTADARKAALDSLCHRSPADIRCALLLREEVESLADSVFVRRCLGALSAEAKPEWLLKSIGDLLEALSDYRVRNRRLSGCKFEVNDSTTLDVGKSRTDHLLIYCWADYDPASVDSLRILSRLVSDDYDYKRVQLLTCCLCAADSTWWRRKTDGLEGMHVWLKAGLADQRMRGWNIEQVPTLILCDSYSNQICRDVWGQELRDALEKLPNRSGFAHTPKNKKHGR